MASEDIFKELMDFLKYEKEETKDLLHKADTGEKSICDRTDLCCQACSGE